MKLSFEIKLVLLLVFAVCANGYINKVMEGFGSLDRVCPTIRSSVGVCHELAKQQCRIPVYTNNECWMKAYSDCNKYCLRSGGKVCNCYDYASSRCASSSSPAEGCYDNVYRECLAGVGLAKDPDR